MRNPYLVKRRFGRFPSVHFQALMIKKLSYNYYNKRITTRDNVSSIQSHDQEKIKLNSTINAHRGAHTLTDEKIIKSPFIKNKVATIKQIKFKQ